MENTYILSVNYNDATLLFTYHLELSTYSQGFSNGALCKMACNIPSLSGLTLQQVAQGLDHGDFTVKELIEAHLARIEEINPTLRAVLQVNPAAVTIATALDEEMKRSGRRG